MTAENHRGKSFRRLRIFALNVALVLISISIILLGGETYIRFSEIAGLEKWLILKKKRDNVQFIETFMRPADDKTPVRMVSQSIPLKKSPATFRVFCFGGSSVFGYPFAPKVSIPIVLRMFLQKVMPARKVEVFNAEFNGGDSSRTLSLMKEALEFNPDLFIVYTGHNEFLWIDYLHDFDLITGFHPSTPLTFLMKIRMTLRKTYLWRWAIGTDLGRKWVQKWESFRFGHSGMQSGRQSVEFLNATFASFKANLLEMVYLAKSRSIPFLLSTVAANHRTLKPLYPTFFKLSEPDLSRFKDLILKISSHIENQQEEIALKLVAEARKIFPNEPYLSFLKSQALLNTGRVKEAKNAIENAILNDGYRHRAPKRINEIIREVAAEREIILSDVEKELEALSPYGIIGDEWIIDHAHPNLEGIILIAKELIRSLYQAGIVKVGDANALSYDDIRRAINLSPSEWRTTTMRLALSEYEHGNVQGASRHFLKASRPFFSGDKVPEAMSLYLNGLAVLLRGDKTLARQNIEEARDIDALLVEDLNKKFAQLKIAQFLGKKQIK